MAKVTAPLFGFSASGSIGDAITFASTRGIKYARQKTTPANPNSTAQQTTRNTWSFVSDVWKNMGSLGRAPWIAYATGQQFGERNAFMGQNLASLRGEADLALFIGSPGAKGGLAPTSIALTPGSTQISVAFTNPSAPTGWTLDSAIAMAIRDQDPASGTLFTTTADEDNVTQNSVDLTGLTASQLYQVVAWLRWLKPDGSTAYGASLIDSATPTA